MATVTQYWNKGGCYQKYGTSDWYWKLGDGQYYWGFAVRPHQANDMVTLSKLSAYSDNDMNQTTILTVTMNTAPLDDPKVRRIQGDGGLLQFTAIKVTTP